MIVYLRCFSASAALNPNPWTLTRTQMHEVLMSKIPWYTIEVNNFFNHYNDNVYICNIITLMINL